MTAVCQKTPEALELRRGAGLAAAAAQRLQDHLDGCPACQQLAHDTEPLALFGGLTRQALPGDIAPFILGGMRVQEPHGARLARSLAWGWLQPLPALAALAAASLLVAWSMRQPVAVPAAGVTSMAGLEFLLPPHAMNNAVATVEDIRSTTAEIFALSMPGEAGPTEFILIVDRSMDL